MIHEAFHAVSAGYVQSDFEKNVGWEEGVVEKLQRLFRVRVLDLLGVRYDETIFIEAERRHAFNRYILALEDIRQAIAQEEEAFYLGLIQTPIRGRYASLVQTALRLHAIKRRQVIEVLSATRPVLEERTRELL